MVAVESTAVGDADGNISDEDTEVESIFKNASHDVGVTGGSNSATSTPTLDTDFHKRLDVKGKWQKLFNIFIYVICIIAICQCLEHESNNVQGCGFIEAPVWNFMMM